MYMYVYVYVYIYIYTYIHIWGYLLSESIRLSHTRARGSEQAPHRSQGRAGFRESAFNSRLPYALRRLSLLRSMREYRFLAPDAAQQDEGEWEG
jgi:hypothetical protein